MFEANIGIFAEKWKCQATLFFRIDFCKNTLLHEVEILGEYGIPILPHFKPIITAGNYKVLTINSLQFFDAGASDTDLAIKLFNHCTVWRYNPNAEQNVHILFCSVINLWDNKLNGM